MQRFSGILWFCQATMCCAGSFERTCRMRCTHMASFRHGFVLPWAGLVRTDQHSPVSCEHIVRFRRPLVFVAARGVKRAWAVALHTSMWPQGDTRGHNTPGCIKWQVWFCCACCGGRVELMLPHATLRLACVPCREPIATGAAPHTAEQTTLKAALCGDSTSSHSRPVATRSMSAFWTCSKVARCRHVFPAQTAVRWACWACWRQRHRAGWGRRHRGALVSAAQCGMPLQRVESLLPRASVNTRHCRTGTHAERSAQPTRPAAPPLLCTGRWYIPYRMYMHAHPAQPPRSSACRPPPHRHIAKRHVWLTGCVDSCDRKMNGHRRTQQ